MKTHRNRVTRIFSNHYDKYNISRIYICPSTAVTSSNSRELAVPEVRSLMKRALLTCILYLFLFKMEKFLGIKSKRPIEDISKEENKRRKFRKYDDDSYQ